MALTDSILTIFNKAPKDPDAPKPPAGSRSEREAKIKDKAVLVINVFADIACRQDTAVENRVANRYRMCGHHEKNKAKQDITHLTNIPVRYK